MRFAKSVRERRNGWSMENLITEDPRKTAEVLEYEVVASDGISGAVSTG